MPINIGLPRCTIDRRKHWPEGERVNPDGSYSVELEFDCEPAELVQIFRDAAALVSKLYLIPDVHIPTEVKGESEQHA